MRVRSLVRLAIAFITALLVSIMPGTPSLAQQPSKSSLSLANEILDVKGSMTIFEAVVPGVIEKSKSMFLQVNPNLFKDVNDVSNDLRKEFAPRLEDLRVEVARLYAQRFTEQELKDTLAFYRSALGKKLLTEEPAFVDRSMSAAQDWAIKLNEEVIQRFRAEMKKRGHPF